MCMRDVDFRSTSSPIGDVDVDIKLFRRAFLVPKNNISMNHFIREGRI